MKQIAAAALVLTLSLPASAEEPGKVEEGFSLFGEASRLLMEGLMEELEPLMDEALEMGEELKPLLDDLNGQLSEMMGDLNAYHAPEVLPNGDIIIRRKTPLDQERPEDDGSIEL